MKSTGMVRHIDDLDRIVIPKELRKTLNLFSKDSLEISINENNKIAFVRSQVSRLYGATGRGTA